MKAYAIHGAHWLAFSIKKLTMLALMITHRTSVHQLSLGLYSMMLQEACELHFCDVLGFARLGQKEDNE